MLEKEAMLPALTRSQMEALSRFAALEIRVDQLRAALWGAFDFDLAPERRTARDHFRVPEPGIVVTRAHIANALEQKRLDRISERDLADWATILLLNDAYVLDPGDEDLIAEWLNDLSLNLDAA
jgi:hypothetical protein